MIVTWVNRKNETRGYAFKGFSPMLDQQFVDRLPRQARTPIA